MPSAPVTVLTVCTGNICRSPAAAYLLNAALPGTVDASSAGTGTRPGWPVHDEIATLLQADGIDLTHDGGSRPVTESLLTSSDLVLALTREHRSRLVSLAPAVLRRTFTLREFARLAPLVTASEIGDAADASERLRAIIKAAGKHRSPVPISEDDIDDPYGGEQSDYARAYLQIRDAVGTIADTVR